VDDILRHFEKRFSTELEKKGFVNLGFFKIGFVYFVSRKEIKGFNQLKSLKIWSWEGDPIVSTMIKTMGLNSVPLPLPDVLSSLTTGIIDSAYAPPMGIIALQWSSKIKYLLDYPLAFSLGAFLLDVKKWKRVSGEHQRVIKQIAHKYITKMNEQTAKENQESIGVLKSLGVKVVKFSKADIAQGKIIRQKILNTLRGSFFSPKIVTEFNSLLR
jgi:TRAP-type C4-dicarboxylate transport system substrate-binding protein